MEKLTSCERELVALGAALASNCVPCIQYHVPEARKTGLDDAKIREAILLADRVRKVPARKVLAVAHELLQEPAPEARVEAVETGCGGHEPVPEPEQPCCV